MSEKLNFINKRTVVAINKMCTSITGGAVTSQNNIRGGQSLSFVDRIFYNELFGTILYPDLYHRAAAYLFYIVKNHTFSDGNKRTGLACALTFLQWNGIVLKPLDEDPVFDFVISIAGGPNNPDTQIPLVAQWLMELRSE